jgi:hypothetical protein
VNPLTGCSDVNDIPIHAPSSIARMTPAQFGGEHVDAVSDVFVVGEELSSVRYVGRACLVELVKRAPMVCRVAELSHRREPNA